MVVGGGSVGKLGTGMRGAVVRGSEIWGGIVGMRRGGIGLERSDIGMGSGRWLG